MTAKEAKAIINKANSKLYRLQQGQFKGQTPASQALAQRLERQGFKLTNKGYISTKGLTARELQRVGTQAQYFNVAQTSTTRGTIQDIANRTGIFQEKTGLEGDELKRLYSIFDSKSYKRLKELVGSDNVVAAASRKLRDNPNINIRNWLYREEKAIRDGRKDYEDFIDYGTGNDVTDFETGEELPF